MGLLYKQLFKQMLKDKIFLSLASLLTMLTSLSFFFVMGSVDGNIRMLDRAQVLTANQQRYKSALHSNQMLAYIFWLSLIGLSSVVFIMFFYRSFRADKKQIGCIKALGFKNSCLQLFFVAFTAVLSGLGAISGLIGGYFLSDILIRANEKTYDVTGLIKGMSVPSLVIGLVVSTMIFCIVALLCYGFVRNEDAGLLLAGNAAQDRFPVTLKIADRISRMAPAQKRLSLRIALRKPLSVSLLFVSVMSFHVCMLLGRSLNISSAKIFDLQTTGHDYAYQIQYQGYTANDISRDVMKYMDHTATITINDHDLERTVSGLYEINALYRLKNKNGGLLATPKAGYVYIDPGLSELYGVKIGDIVTITIADRPYHFIVGEIAANAQTDHIYMNGGQLTEILGIPAGSYNGVFSAYKLDGDLVISREQRIEELIRDSVSNKTSAVIDQVIGVLVGAILLFLALHISFQDDTHDILILRMLGYPIRYIQSLLVDIYLPVLWVMFGISLAPSILLARTIQNSLSISTNEYMPFGTDLLVIITAFGLINLIYQGVLAVFRFKIKTIIEKGEIANMLYAE